MSINSSTVTDSRALAHSINPSRANKFLCELANLHDEERSGERFEKRWGQLFLPEIPTSVVRQWAILGEEEDIASLSAEQQRLRYWLLPLRDYVRHLWISDPRTKNWGVFMILEKFFGFGFRGPMAGPWTSDSQWFQGKDLPPESNCERVFTRLAACTAFCQNADCPAPYYFAARRGQKYCSEECAGPTQREFKINWWNEHGAAWRAKRRQGKRGAAKELGRPKKVAEPR